MNQKEKQISKLIFKYLLGKCSVREVRRLTNWLEEDDDNKVLFQSILNPDILQSDLDILNSFEGEKAWRKRKQKKNKELIRWFVAASILLLTFSYVIHDYISFDNDPKLKYSNINTQKEEIGNQDKLPAKVGAQLILSDGQKIQLNKPLVVKPTGDVYNTDDKLITKTNQDHSNESIKWLEIQVPTAQFYSIILPDSTKVWLNSNSKIKFPSHFNKNNRVVSIVGEAYFEVKHNPNQPFIVKTNQADIRVLGTSFNVNNYNNNLTASLAEGKIELITKTATKNLKPLQKAIVSNDGLSIMETDLQKELAWKNNKFLFKNDKLSDILLEIENWYGIQTNYHHLPNNEETFTGTINRNVKLSKILEILNKTSKYQFKIINNKLIISSTKI